MTSTEPHPSERPSTSTPSSTPSTPSSHTPAHHTVAAVPTSDNGVIFDVRPLIAVTWSTAILSIILVVAAFQKTDALTFVSLYMHMRRAWLVQILFFLSFCGSITGYAAWRQSGKMLLLIPTLINLVYFIPLLFQIF
ncbi:hypothetical protein B9G54_02660 [Alloscardovia macacae]|uniref:Uncharacterized protein n=1 Tax=Alloscardovia macacae TaxID=1160091 RepID=A0A1Y2T0I3_9BIFI|nr:hypothetical protein [Alloscardovia macacae]OTA26949.1 hypothetical protein B9G54_02660 [Alloscardovia macacae]OTA30063.1 hypothetical protein B9T39_01490 [Alloscardovia macacae]